MKALVFDLDGTLVDTKYDMLDAGNLVFESQGWSARLEGFSGLQIAIQGGKAILRYGLQEEGIAFGILDGFGVQEFEFAVEKI